MLLNSNVNNFFSTDSINKEFKTLSPPRNYFDKFNFPNIQLNSNNKSKNTTKKINLENKESISFNIIENMNDSQPNHNILKELDMKENLEIEQKKLKLVNVYNSLSEFRKNLLNKENELNEKEKKLIEFEKILKNNEQILQNNIEKFEEYLKNKIKEIKSQFDEIQKIQRNKEISLKKKEEEINKYLTEYKYKLSNISNNSFVYDNQSRKNITTYNFKTTRIPPGNIGSKMMKLKNKLTSRSHNNISLRKYNFLDRNENQNYYQMKTENNNNKYYFSYGSVIYKRK